MSIDQKCNEGASGCIFSLVYKKEWASVNCEETVFVKSHKEQPFKTASQCFPHFETQISLSLLDDCLVDTVGKPSNEVHVSIKQFSKRQSTK